MHNPKLEILGCDTLEVCTRTSSTITGLSAVPPILALSTFVRLRGDLRSLVENLRQVIEPTLSGLRDWDALLFLLLLLVPEAAPKNIQKNIYEQEIQKLTEC